ncbi:conserved Plasmodium protein, unknown function [Plasmodium gaboni]|uniref:Uncharacterized protein n=1 Tax=Plasmodium gaboni TaxID=647221 RepID=A0ABY0KWG0_9APIC|nr:conserved Plasmodium protein, unknown function [Plasmodium gaboni]
MIYIKIIYFSKQSSDVYNKNLIKKKDTKEIDRNEFNRDVTKSNNTTSDYIKKKSTCIDISEDQNVCNNDNNIINYNNLIKSDENNMNKNNNEIIKKKGKKYKCDKKDEDKLNPSFSYSSNITLNNSFEKQQEHSQHSNSMCDNKDLKEVNIPKFESGDTIKKDESIQVIRNNIQNMKHNNKLNQQDTFDVISKTYDIKNNFSIDIELKQHKI